MNQPKPTWYGSFAIASSYFRTSSFAEERAAAVAGPTSTDGPPPPPPPPPVPVPVVLETVAVVFAVVALIEEGVAEAETKLNEDAASRAAVDASRMLSMFVAEFLVLLLLAEADAVHAGFTIINADGGR